MPHRHHFSLVMLEINVIRKYPPPPPHPRSSSSSLECTLAQVCADIVITDCARGFYIFHLFYTLFEGRVVEGGGDTENSCGNESC